MRQYQLIFMDCMMPVMDGFQATQTIRESVSTQECMIVALSAMTHKTEIEKGAKCGMDEFLTKPPEIDRLRSVLGKIFTQ